VRFITPQFLCCYGDITGYTPWLRFSLGSGDRVPNSQHFETNLEGLVQNVDVVGVLTTVTANGSELAPFATHLTAAVRAVEGILCSIERRIVAKADNSRLDFVGELTRRKEVHQLSIFVQARSGLEQSGDKQVLLVSAKVGLEDQERLGV